MKPDAFVVGVVLFSLIMYAGAYMIMDMSSNYNVEYEADFLDNFTKHDFGGYTKEGKDAVSIAQGEAGDIGNWWNILTQSVSGFFNTLWSPFGMVTGMMDYATQKLNIDPVFSKFFTTIIAVLGIFAIAYIIFRIRSW